MKRLALCIGNNDYSDLTRLNGAVNDAQCMAEALKELGFDATCECNLNRAQMVDIITDFIDRLEEYESAVFYYAGHGCQIDGENILAPTDLIVSGKVSSIKYNAFPLEDLMRSLDKYPEKTKIFIFDACRDVLKDRGTLRGFAPVLAPQGSIIAFATSPGQSSGEDPSLNHGYYTETLLRYIKLPRVNVETVFKKTREAMVGRFGAMQIPWEHTSLVGDYFLNPNTIYDGVNYSPDALADSRFHTSNNEVRAIIEGLKSYNWYTQGPVLKLIEKLKLEEITPGDLFVIGRNIYQAATGSCFDAQQYIDNFSGKDISSTAKLHILNGMAYEIYFSSANMLRIHPKTGYYKPIIQLLEKEEFYGSKAFIASMLCKIENQVIYIPGQNEIMEFTVELNDDNELQKLLYKGKNVLFNEEGNEYDGDVLPFECPESSLRSRIASQIAAPDDCISIIGIEENSIKIPYTFTVRYVAAEVIED